MTTSFNGWLNSWSGWGGATDPNEMRGSASFVVNAIGTLSAPVIAVDMQGFSAFSINAQGYLTTVTPPEQPESYPTTPASTGSHGFWGKPYKGTFLSPGAIPWVPPVPKGRRRKRRDLDILFLTR